MESVRGCINSLHGHHGAESPSSHSGDRADGSVTERLTRKGRHGECVGTLGRGAAAAGRGGRRTRSEKKAQLVERWCPNTGAFKLLESCDFLLLPVWAVDQ